MSLAPRFIWLPGLFAVLVGVGLGRFAYTPLLPALVEQGWLAEAPAAYAGAANLLGYLVGALIAQMLAARPERIALLNGALLAAAVSLIACAWPLGFSWLASWRFVAGMAGAFIIVLGPATILAATPPPERAKVSGMIFVGVGIGIILSGVVLPGIAARGLVFAWLLLGTAAFALTAVTWRLWPRTTVGAAPPDAALPGRLTVLLLILAYASDGIGFVPHTLFLSDFVARGLGRGEVAGGVYWAVFGVGAVVGAPICGMIATRFGLVRTFVAALAVKAAAVALPLLLTAPLALALSAFLVGALTPGMVALAAGLAAMLANGPAQARLFGAMTIAFALAQAGGGYLMSWLFGVTQSHLPLFILGATMLFLGAVSASVAALRLHRM